MDEEELAEATAQINRELYVFEDRVAVLEAAPAAVGGGTATYTLCGQDYPHLHHNHLGDRPDRHGHRSGRRTVRSRQQL